jgi:diguanylate cyclase (GGDEF)-like protein
MFRNKLLVVDDDPHIFELLKVNLENEGYQIFHAGDGEEALDLAQKENPDLIVLDIMMPKIDGFEVCLKLRQNDNTYLIPIIVLSAKDAPEDKIMGLKLGADDYITKPFNIEELIARIDTRLKRTKQFLSANPLTGLPGNVSIMYEANKRLRNSMPFGILYVDIDSFKPFNDKYGFREGDEVIKFVADILKKSVEKGDFVGHIGGDDFIVISQVETAEHICNKIIELFDGTVQKFYNEEDRKRNFIESKDRKGDSQQFPIMTLSIGLLLSGRHDLSEYGKLIEIITELKKQAKASLKSGKSVYFKERRMLS